MYKSGEKTELKPVSKTRRAFILLFCGAIAILLWFASGHKQQFKESIPVALSFVNLPPHLIPTFVSDTIIQIQMISNKWIIAQTKEKASSFVLDLTKVDLVKKGHIWEGVVPISEVISQMQEVLPDFVKIKDYSPSFIVLRFESRAYKKVPVGYNVSYSLAPGYYFSSSIIMDPDSVIVSGEAGKLRLIKKVETEVVTLKQMNKSLVKDVKLIRPKYPKTFDISPQVAKVYFPIEQYSEKVFEVPITYKSSMLEGREIKLYPSVAKIKCMLPVDEYNHYTVNDFKVMVNVKDLIDNQSSQAKLILEIAKAPLHSKIVSITPKQVEFLFIER